MKIKVNEQYVEIADLDTTFGVRVRYKRNADLMILNGFPVTEDVRLEEGDEVVLIRRGEKPTEAELEALMTSRHTPGVHEIIKGATVGIAGVGGLGSSIAIALARVGVGRIIVADFDVVEPSNLNRQQYFIDQIGMHKVDALRANIKRINPYVTIVPHAIKIDATNLSEIFAEVDVMVEAFDNPEQKAMLTEIVLSEMAVPLVAASGMAGYAPSNSIATRRKMRNFYLVGDEVTAAGPGEGLMAPRVGIAAHHQANAVLRLLLGEEPE